ncbi:MAG: TIGR03936 family radical SAM-associated protein [Bacteroidales bacterium]|nr:TIGR03936 family radical SAM-associated protein [Bacteroidales bacterium]MCM1422365.1 TIGR03936 family radical SAM-associated protein [bacterium]
MKVRIKFAKYGVMKFIGHLDMMRFFQKAVRRAGIDVKYSEGYSPHQIMSFAAPLGVGIESCGEYLDMEVLSMDSCDDMKQALNAVMADGVEILSVSILPDSAKNAMASVAAAAYQIHKKEEPYAFCSEGLTDAVNNFLAQETILHTKETKKNVIETNIRSGIFDLHAGKTQVTRTGTSAAAAMFLADEPLITVPCLAMTVDASSAGNIKPTVVFEKFCAFAGLEIPLSAIQVTRLETYADMSKEGELRHLVPLNAVS